MSDILIKKSVTVPISEIPLWTKRDGQQEPHKNERKCGWGIRLMGRTHHCDRPSGHSGMCVCSCGRYFVNPEVPDE
jgi:hypothetical protein